MTEKELNESQAKEIKEMFEEMTKSIEACLDMKFKAHKEDVRSVIDSYVEKLYAEYTVDGTISYKNAIYFEDKLSKYLVKLVAKKEDVIQRIIEHKHRTEEKSQMSNATSKQINTEVFKRVVKKAPVINKRDIRPQVINDVTVEDIIPSCFFRPVSTWNRKAVRAKWRAKNKKYAHINYFVYKYYGRIEANEMDSLEASRSRDKVLRKAYASMNNVTIGVANHKRIVHVKKFLLDEYTKMLEEFDEDKAREFKLLTEKLHLSNAREDRYA